jgi:asparagine synthase (glutamine-hydrolysing)
MPPSAAAAALSRLASRGPDGLGEWQGDGIYLGHRRLAIIDLDPRAVQPMHSSCGRYAIAFNGEIYNYRELRKSLEEQGVAFRTTSDTEVVMELFRRDGDTMLPKLEGMFAFVIWDKHSRSAFAARDPYGIKPIYYAHTKSGWLIGSQVKALLATDLVPRTPCVQGQAGYWLLGSVPEPYTWFDAIRSVRAGHYMIFTAATPPVERCWHDIGAAWRDAEDSQASASAPHRGSSELRERIYESVQRHMVADVPVGLFLSGGIDSSAVAGLMSDTGAQALCGVTLRFEEFAGTPSDESPGAASAAQCYRISHHLRTVGTAEFRSDLQGLLADMDQPSIDGVNTWYASKAASELGLKVVMSGVGGDELFLGYPLFRTIPRLLRWRGALDALPAGRTVAAALGRWRARRTGNQRWAHAESWSRTVEGAWWLRRSVRAPEELPALLGADEGHAFLRKFDPVEMVRSMTGALARDPVLALGQIESMTYLRNQLLRDSDWASMAHSLELRTPLVDAKLLSGLVPCLRGFGSGPVKAMLANAPRQPVPASIAGKRKTGFGIPVSHWLGKPSGRLSVEWAARVAAQCYSWPPG